MAIILPNLLMQVNRRQWVLLVMLFIASMVTISLFNSDNFSGSGSLEFGGLGIWNSRFQRKAGNSGNGNATDPGKGQVKGHNKGDPTGNNGSKTNQTQPSQGGQAPAPANSSNLTTQASRSPTPAPAPTQPTPATIPTPPPKATPTAAPKPTDPPATTPEPTTPTTQPATPPPLPTTAAPAPTAPVTSPSPKPAPGPAPPTNTSVTSATTSGPAKPQVPTQAPPLSSPAPPNPFSTSSSKKTSSDDGDRLPDAPRKEWTSDFSCKPETKESEEFCGSLCEVLRRSVAKKPKSNTLEIAFGILVAILMFANVGLYLFRKAQDKRKKEKENQKMVKEQKALKGPVKTGFANKADYPALKPPEKKVNTKSEKSEEEISPLPPIDLKQQAKLRKKIADAQVDLAKLRAHVKKRNAEHKSDTRSDKFQKKGPIFIPMEPDLPPPAVLPDNVVLDKVTYDPSGNEMYDIGSDVDDIEMDSSLVLDPSTMTEEEASRASQKGSKMEGKKDKGKDKTTESKKTDVKKDDKDDKSKSKTRE